MQTHNYERNCAQNDEIDLQKLLKCEAWIGLSSAVDWIAFRGKPFEDLDEVAYNAAIEEASRQLIARLAQIEADLADGTALRIVKGVWEGEEKSPDNHTCEILWGNASEDIFDYDRGKYYLSLTGEPNPGGATGALIGQDDSWVRISVTTKFIRKFWPVTPVSVGSEVSQKRLRGQGEVEREIQRIFHACPPEISPLPKEKMLLILRHTIPGVTKQQCNAVYDPGKSRGPRPGRSRETTSRMYREFIRKMTGAEFPN